MNSLIIAKISVFLTVFASAFKKSKTYRLFLGVYTAFSLAWKNSSIITFLKKERYTGLSEGSILHKIVYIPFAICSGLITRLSALITNVIEGSAFVRISKCCYNNVLALNTRFLGCAAISMSVMRTVITRNLDLISAAWGIAGCIFIVINCNITAFIKESMLVRFFMNATGFSDVSWKFYDVKIGKRADSFIGAIILGIVIGVLSLQSISLAILLPVFYVAICIILACPLAGVFFAVILAPFTETMILAGICSLTFFSLVLKTRNEEDFKWKLDGVGTSLAFFLLFMLASCIFSFNVLKSMMVWGMYLIFVGFYIVIINTVKSKEQVYSLLKMFIISGAIVAAYGVCQYIFGWNTTNAWIDETMFKEATMRAYSTMENPNVLGEYLLLVIPLAAAFMLKAKNKPLEQLFSFLILCISLLCMVFTQSRGCWLGLMLAAAVFITFYNGKIWGLLPFALLLLPYFIPETMVDRFMSIGNLEDTSTSYRVFIWLGTLEMLKDFWLGGIGMGEGAFGRVYPAYAYDAIEAPHSHNTFLQLWVEGGIAALILFIVTVYVFVKKMSGVYIKKGKESMDGIFALAINSGIIGFLLQSMFDYTFYNYRMMAMFFMIIALGMSLTHIKEENQSEDN